MTAVNSWVKLYLCVWGDCCVTSELRTLVLGTTTIVGQDLGDCGGISVDLFDTSYEDLAWHVEHFGNKKWTGGSLVANFNEGVVRNTAINEFDNEKTSMHAHPLVYLQMD